jgi:hypothetical protein
MNAEMVSRLMSLIPERSPRAQMGAAFVLEGSACRYPDRLALISKFLHWMSPLESLTKEDQQALGLRNALGRPIHASDLEEELDGEDLLPEEQMPEPAEIRAESVESPLVEQEKEAALA